MQPLIDLIRIENNPADGTFAVIKINGHAFCAAIEPPWKNNQEDISCIPCGCYIMHLVESKSFGTVYEVQDVDDRSDIYFHWGNFCTDTEGCILLGDSFGLLFTQQYSRGKRGVRNSIHTFKRFMLKLKDAPVVKLVIREI